LSLTADTGSIPSFLQGENNSFFPALIGFNPYSRGPDPDIPNVDTGQVGQSGFHVTDTIVATHSRNLKMNIFHRG
jgi:hypothetical protein